MRARPRRQIDWRGSVPTVIPLFGVAWTELQPADVESFLREAGEEGVTWEAKSDDARGRLRPDSIRKAACGLANRIGGYLLIGARWSKETTRWELPGIAPPDDEPELWIGKVLRGLNPTPRFEPKVWRLDDDRVVAIVWIEPVDAPPCMTPQGQVYERVSGDTLPVRDPALLAALFRRGRQAQARAEKSADAAAARALEAPRWYWQRAVGISIALAPVGRETDDISARLFVPSFREAIVQSLWRFFQSGHPLRRREQPDDIEQWPQQDAFGVLAHFEGRRVLEPDQSVRPQPQSTWLMQATWDGAVAASATFSPEAVAHLSGPDEVVLPAWREVAALVPRLGGYGPAQLTLGVYASPVRPAGQPVVHGDAAGAPPPPPPEGTLYRRLQEHTWIRRRVSVAEPTTDMLGSLQRELQRASGIESFEP